MGGQKLRIKPTGDLVLVRLDSCQIVKTKRKARYETGVIEAVGETVNTNVGLTMNAGDHVLFRSVWLHKIHFSAAIYYMMDSSEIQAKMVEADDDDKA